MPSNMVLKDTVETYPIPPLYQRIPPGPPLDYSFQHLINIEDLAYRKIRQAESIIDNDHNNKDQHRRRAYNEYEVTGALRLSYNPLTNIQGLPELLDHSILTPIICIKTLWWLDLSHCHFIEIPSCLSALPQLNTLYLHANLIESITSLPILLHCPSLVKLTLHGNPFYKYSSLSSSVAKSIAAASSTAHLYRRLIISLLDKKDGYALKSLDFISITQFERDMARRSFIHDRNMVRKRKLALHNKSVADTTQLATGTGRKRV